MKFWKFVCLKIICYTLKTLYSVNLGYSCKMCKRTCKPVRVLISPIISNCKTWNWYLTQMGECSICRCLLLTMDMSVPLAAVLQQKTAASPSDFQAYLFGSFLRPAWQPTLRRTSRWKPPSWSSPSLLWLLAEDDIFQGKTIKMRTLQKS